MNNIYNFNFNNIKYINNNLCNRKAGHNLFYKILTSGLSIIISIIVNIILVIPGIFLTFVILNLQQIYKDYLYNDNYDLMIVLIITIIYFINTFALLNNKFNKIPIFCIFISIILGTILISILPSSNNLGVGIVAFGFSILITWIGIIIIACSLIFNLCISDLSGYICLFINTLIIFPINKLLSWEEINSEYNFYIFNITIALTIIILGYIIARKSLKNSNYFAWIRKPAIFLAGIGGTSFKGCDLTDICFDDSDLPFTDFRNTQIIRTSFEGVTGLDLARLQGTILENDTVRNLLITKQGKKQDFTGLNFNGASLQRADFTGANLSQIQALDADFSDAILTDACIEGWNINQNTRFQGVKCEWIYLKNNQQERKPDSGNFKEGEFEQWITELEDTIDLIFHQGLNWKAFAFSLAQTTINQDGLDLSRFSIQNQGIGTTVVKLGVFPDTNKAQIHEEFTTIYAQAVKLIEDKYQLVLQAKEDEIGRLRDLLNSRGQELKELINIFSATHRPLSIQGEGNRIYLLSQVGEFMEGNKEGDRHIYMGGGNYKETNVTGNATYIEGDNYNQSGSFGIGHMSGGTIEKGAKVAGVLNEAQSKTLAQAAQEIQNLLQQLTQSYPSSTTVEQITLATELVKEIEKSPTIKQRVLNAGKEALFAFVDKSLDTPLGAAGVALVKGYIEAEAQ